MGNTDIIANAVLLSQGFCIPITSDEVATEIVNAFLRLLSVNEKAEDIINEIRKTSNATIHFITANTVNDDIHITFVLDKDICNTNGVFSYVYNQSCSIFSEFGYTFFENDNGKVHRIG